ncbi:MAG: hypothetical protein F4069_02410 [Rhodothermaceae bacterium]|nr:hypothetical protein [Rhodothermaceae bacterium]MYG68552.1 hypothetical protein [Rhodothermaceae bacterium]MYJ44174.1 hypothetical protein [Rhodothermaceae bacterium]
MSHVFVYILAFTLMLMGVLALWFLHRHGLKKLYPRASFWLVLGVGVGMGLMFIPVDRERVLWIAPVITTLLILAFAAKYRDLKQSSTHKPLKATQ